jgi:hypothetical protein
MVVDLLVMEMRTPEFKSEHACGWLALYSSLEVLISLCEAIVGHKPC